jgi:16S rRNA (guanine527-N7)-methyltransferase
MSLAAQLEAGAMSLGLELSGTQRDALCKYLDLLKKWNRVYNLTAIRDENEMLTHHLLDSLAVVPFLSEENLLDVGSGPGFPGIPIAIAKPQQAVTVLDSNDKKCAFMRQAVAELNLENVSVCLQRVEVWTPGVRYSQIISRAFASLPDFVERCRRLLAPGGQLLAMKGQFPQDEIQVLPADFELQRTQRLDVPGLNAERHLLWLAPKNEHSQ